MTAGPYAVVAHRWGLRDAHSYVVGCFTSKRKAVACAEQAAEARGGKYGVEVTNSAGEQIHYVESPCFGWAGRFSAANHAADTAKGILPKPSKRRASP